MGKLKPELTDADKYALERMPDEGWFSEHDLPAVIRCPRYRCERLVEKGVLEWEVIGQYPQLESRWRKVPAA